ncbi:glycosyltransferase [Ornithinimicrobium sp. INDO-MA30-4]|uniref:glycosyltransferase n=1 Tax=Ornithinimicrobium sp. INDO-MA30-4 TaxID=2908651 RepID=UPI0037C64ADA
MVPEKGADLAVAAARHADRPLRLIGPIGDPAWFTARLQPLLGGNVHYEGHLSQNQTANVVGSAGLLLMTPRWDEPFGLVAVESALTGTPVLALRRGGLAEVLDEHMGVLVSPGDTDEATSLALAAHVDSTAAMPRAEVRASAMQRFSVAAMVAAYEDIYRKTIAEW